MGPGGRGRQGACTQKGGVGQGTRTPQGLASAGLSLRCFPELTQTQSSVCKSRGLGLPSSGFLESQKSRGVPCTWAGVCVLQEPCFHGKQSLRIPKGQTVSRTAERGASGCLVLESVENKDNVDIWGCDVTESQPFKGKNHLSIYPACNIQCFAHLSNWITIFSSL